MKVEDRLPFSSVSEGTAKIWFLSLDGYQHQEGLKNLDLIGTVIVGIK